MSAQKASPPQPKPWRYGVRLYIAIAIGLVTVEGWWWAVSSYNGDLRALRLEELFAWLSIALLATAISIGPFYKIFPKTPAKPAVFDSRRLLGVGAAWFALLHVAIVYDKLYKFSNPLSLPEHYQLSSLVGLVALVILTIMMVTSFDAAQRGLGIWWFRIHRFVYLAAGLSLLHTLMIGSHAFELFPFATLIAIAVLIFIAETLAVLLPKKPATKWQIIALTLSFIFLLATIGYGVAKHGSDSSLSMGTIERKIA